MQVKEPVFVRSFFLNEPETTVALCRVTDAVEPIHMSVSDLS